MRYWKSLAKRAAYVAKANRNYTSQSFSQTKSSQIQSDAPERTSDEILSKLKRTIPFEEIQIGQFFYFGNRNIYKFEKINTEEAICHTSSGVKLPHPFSADTPVKPIGSKVSQASALSSFNSQQKTQINLSNIDDEFDRLDQEFDELDELLNDALLEFDEPLSETDQPQGYQAY